MPRNLTVPFYSIGVFGALLQIWGGYWDVSWHGLGLVETFFGINHIPLYSGVALVIFASVLGVTMRFRSPGDRTKRYLSTGLMITAAGGFVQVIAGPFDFWWHGNFGFDPFLFTPSHSLLIGGIVLSGLGVSVGSLRLLHAYRSDGLRGYLAYSKWLQVLVIISLATLWLDINTVVYIITDVDGMAYTFQLSNTFTAQAAPIAFVTGLILVAIPGTLILFSAKRILRWTGGATSVAALVVIVSATANLGFRAGVLTGSQAGFSISQYIPLYLLFLIPIAIFDIFLKESWSRSRMLVSAALIGPFASFLDGWFSVELWMFSPTQLIPLTMVPMALAGLVAWGSRVRFVQALSPDHFVAVQNRE